jgi:hypothetical protein
VRVRNLILAYDERRPLTDGEHAVLPDFFAAYVAADAVGKLSWWWRGEGRARPVRDSAAARVFFQVSGSSPLFPIAENGERR